MSSECGICIEKYNRSNRLPVNCGACDFQACRACYEQFLLQQPQAKCMSCAKEFTRHDLVSKMTRRFINQELKSYRERYLFEQEKAMLPATQPVVEQILEREKIQNQIISIRIEISRKWAEIRSLENRYNNTLGASAERKTFVRKCPNSDCRGFLSTQWKCNLCSKKTCKDCNECILDDEHKCDPNNVETAKLIAQDSKPCPSCGELIFKIDGCFAKDTPIQMWDGSIKLSQDIRVGDILVGDEDFGKPRQRRVLDLCSGQDDLFRVEQEDGMDYVVNSKHTLVLLSNEVENKEVEITVEDYLKLPQSQADLLLGWKSDDGCSPVSRIKVTPIGKGQYYGWMVDVNHRFLLADSTVVRNCDQIFCTKCHTAFSWRTGRLETGAIHNPHYYEWLRMNNQQLDDTLIVQCGREIDHYFIRRLTRLCGPRFEALARNLIHFREVVLPTYATHPFADNEDLRIQYLRKQLQEDAFRVLLQKREKARQKKQEYHRLGVMVVQCITDILYRLVDELLSDKDERESICERYSIELQVLLSYVNECFRNIANAYGSRVKKFSENLVLF